MKMQILLISVFFLVIISSCQKKEEDNTTIVNGFVIDSLTNIPIKDADVQLYKSELFDEMATSVSGYDTVTDSIGKFYVEFESEKGFIAYYLKVSKNGYINNSQFGDLIHIETRKSQRITIKMSKEN